MSRWRTIAMLVGAPAAGAAAGLALLVFAILPHVSLGEVQRIAELGRHLEEALPAPRLVLLGDSIVRDGFDAEQVSAAAPPGWHVENLGLSGCGLNERRVLLPRLLETRPAAVALGLYPTNLCAMDRLGADKGYAYAYTGFVAAWPSDRTRADFPGITQESWQALGSTRTSQWLHFRTVPANWFDQKLRVALRSDLRAGHEDDWVHPYTRSGSIRGPRLERHLDGIRRASLECPDSGWDAAWQAVARLVDEIAAGGALPVLVLLPVHPELQASQAPLAARLRQRAEQLASAAHIPVLDALDALAAEDFADAVHPNAEGRARLSALAGRGLPATGP